MNAIFIAVVRFFPRFFYSLCQALWASAASAWSKSGKGGGSREEESEKEENGANEI